MSSLTINPSMQAANAPQRNTARAASAVSVSPPAVSSVIQAGEYTSSKGVIDSKAGVYVVQFRDSDTGAVRMQYPAKQAAGVYKKTASTVEARTNAPAPAPAPAPVAPQASGTEQPSAGASTSGGSKAEA